MRMVLAIYGLMVLAATAAAFGGAAVPAVVWLTVMTAAVVILARDIDKARFLVPDRVPTGWTAR